MSQTHPLQPSMKNQPSIVDDIEVQNKVLLICDLTGKIVFWKGDPKVFQTPSQQYLGKNLLSFDFTLLSRLKLSAYLTTKLLKPNSRKEFQLEIIKKDKNQKPKSLEKSSKYDRLKLEQFLLSNIKVLKVAASLIQTFFSKQNQCKESIKLQTFHKQNKNEDPHQSPINQHQRGQYFLMIEVEAKSKTKDILKSQFFTDYLIEQTTKSKQSQLRDRYFDLKFVKQNSLRLKSDSEKYEQVMMSNDLYSNYSKEFELESLFGSNRKPSAFQPNKEFFRRMQQSLSEEKKAWEKTPSKKRLWTVGNQ